MSGGTDTSGLGAQGMADGKDEDHGALLLQDVAAGSRAAFRTLYQDYSALVFGVLLRMTQNRAQSEELLQEVFIKVWRKARHFTPERSRASTWLVAIARNTAIDAIRRNARRPQTELIDENNGGVTSSSEEATLHGDDMRVLNLCMSQLDEKYQWAVQRAYLDGYSYQEIAEALDTPLNTLKSWLRRSLQRLRDCMESAT